MPRWACREVSEVKRIRAERVQEISEEDAIAEGILYVQHDDIGGHFEAPSIITRSGIVQTDFAVEAFSHLWDTINYARGYGWEVNPWVWCVDYMRTEAKA